MRIAVHEVSKGKKGHALPTTSLEIETGHARFVLAETELRPTVLGLIATGRMRPDSGRVTIDGTRNDRDLRRRMALVDAPEVSDPHPGVTLAAVVGEELMFAGLPATPLHARRWLEQIGFAELASQPIGTIKPSVRVRVMAELAVLRDDVEGFVLVSPDRHGGRPEGWWRIASEFADRGFAVLVIVGGSAAAVIEQLPEALETDYPSNATVPVRPLADITGSTTVIDADPDPVDPVVEEEPVAEPVEAPTPDPPVADPVEAATPDNVPSRASGTDDTATAHPTPTETETETETENGAER
ncbi:hypothetical protein SAMN04488591_1921 [Microbacterium azadirachtae]|uniref:ABC transporter ATP-binding protein n=1 Tax=Microbacterium azadirachtae TaxID=582680 RepID=A0A1I6HL36_9MICO|nr:hypothetical protein [Microbacterium azadirachtae]SFR55114.1 hypothetical protein SAMN04488591_1921 [Microbacterium azadirachtae]